MTGRVDALHCPSGWTGPISYDSGTTYSCYRQYTNTDDRMNWADSETACVTEGGHLASLSTAGEQAWVDANISLSYGTWISLNDHYREGMYMWWDGSLLSDTNWASGQPSGGGSSWDCVFMSSTDGEWYDAWCSYANDRLCELTASCTLAIQHCQRSPSGLMSSTETSAITDADCVHAVAAGCLDEC